MKFLVSTFGCRVNQADSAAIRQSFLTAEYEETQCPQEADVIVVNSCTVTHRTDQQVRQLTRKMRRDNPRAQIVITGCYAQRDPDPLARIRGVHAVVGNTRKGDLVEICQDTRSLEVPSTEENNSSSIFRDDFVRVRSIDLTPATEVGGRTRPYVKIQDGCDAGCAYCVIPMVRGPSRSVPPEVILKQIRELVEEGFREIVLTGIHIGSYGMHLRPRYPLDRLLGQIVGLPGLGRIRLSSIEPMELSRRIIDIAAQSGVIAPHFHICLQSGSDGVLRRMRRPYSSKKFGDIVEEIRVRIPHAAIGTDLIVGFPGETETEHRETVQFVQRMPFTYAHVFPYSDREGTPASRMRDKVVPRVIRRRSEELRELSDLKQRVFRRQFVGKSLSALTLAAKVGAMREGLSSNYLKIKVSALVPGNRLIEGKVDREEGAYLVLAEQGLRLQW